MEEYAHCLRLQPHRGEQGHHLAINDLLDQMHADGTLSELSNKWFEMDITGVPDGEVNYVTTTGDNAWQSNEG